MSSPWANPFHFHILIQGWHLHSHPHWNSNNQPWLILPTNNHHTLLISNYPQPRLTLPLGHFLPLPHFPISALPVHCPHLAWTPWQHSLSTCAPHQCQDDKHITPDPALDLGSTHCLLSPTDKIQMSVSLIPPCLPVCPRLLFSSQAPNTPVTLNQWMNLSLKDRPGYYKSPGVCL